MKFMKRLRGAGGGTPCMYACMRTYTYIVYVCIIRLRGGGGSTPCLRARAARAAGGGLASADDSNDDNNSNTNK